MQKKEIKRKKLIRRFLSERQMSESFITGMFLALSGGFQDAYTYNCRDGVFSNAQTGNIVLMSQSLMTGDRKEMIHYLLPVLAFALGVFLVENIHYRFQNAKVIHWRQGIVMAEIVLLAIVGFIPQTHNITATVLVSLACAMQVQAFRKVGGYAYASTMCIGNLRSGTDALSKYLREHNPKHRRQACYYFGIIIVFAVGAGFGGIFTINYGIRVIWISCGLLFISFILMSLEKLK